MRVQVKDPWQRKMTPGKTMRLELDVQFAMPTAQLREGTLRLRLVSRETGREALTRQIKSPRSQQLLTLDVRALPWGAYDLQAGFLDRTGREVVSVKRLAAVLPGGKQQVRVLNNLVSELMDARSRGLLASRRIEFMNPRDGWVWLSAAGNCALTLAGTTQLRSTDGSPHPSLLPSQARGEGNLPQSQLSAPSGSPMAGAKTFSLSPRQRGEGWGEGPQQLHRSGDDRVLTAEEGKPAAEAMRLLSAGRHVLQVGGTPSDLVVRAIPALVYNVYPSSTQIAPFGANTWERLRKHTLPNANMIESHLVDVPEQKEWTAHGKKWLANVQAPGLIDTKEWTEEKLLELWLKPGTSTAHAERPGLELAKVSGMQVDEYYPGAKSTRFMVPLARSLTRLAEFPEAAGKFWIPFTAGKYGATPDNLLMRTVLGAGWPFSEEVYAGEMPTEAENLDRLRAQFRSVAESYESAHPGSVRRMIFTPMYAYLPYCTANRYPQADFRVHLDMQMQLLASDPAFFGLWGVQPYRSNYVDEEILNCMGRLLRHYCIEGKTARMLSDPYELRHVTDPDFEKGTTHWQVAAAEDGAVGAGQFAGYGTLEGRYPTSAVGDTFLRLKRNAKRPNVVSQQLQGLKTGRLYSLKLISADRDDLRAGKSRKATQAISITLDGAEVLPGGFSYPFHSCREVKQFTSKSPFWMTYHYLRFRATGPTAKLVISDWAKPDAPGAPIGQELILNFVELQPVLE
jgi:hypothetical protein